MKRYSSEYCNAVDVLPEELLRKLQQLYTGAVWIPPVVKRAEQVREMEERNREIVALYKQGECIKDIAERFFICQKRVRQIVRQSSAIK